MGAVSFTGLSLILLFSYVHPGALLRAPVQLWSLEGRQTLIGPSIVVPRGKMSSSDYSLTWYGEANTQDNADGGMEKPWPVLRQLSSWWIHLRPSRRRLLESPPQPLQRRRRLLSPAGGGSEVLVMLSRDYSHRPRSRPPVNNRQALNHREVHRP